MADGFDDDMTRCPCCDGEGYFYHGDEPKSPWGDAATIARLTKERDEAHERFVFWRNEADKRTAALAQARADLAASYDRAAAAISDTDALTEIVKRAVDAEAREMRTVLTLIKRAGDLREVYHSLPNEHNRIGDKRSRKGHARDAWLRAFRKADREARAILARIDQRKEAGA